MFLLFFPKKEISKDTYSKCNGDYPVGNETTKMKVNYLNWRGQQI